MKSSVILYMLLISQIAPLAEGGCDWGNYRRTDHYYEGARQLEDLITKMRWVVTEYEHWANVDSKGSCRHRGNRVLRVCRVGKHTGLKSQMNLPNNVSTYPEKESWRSQRNLPRS